MNLICCVAATYSFAGRVSRQLDTILCCLFSCSDTQVWRQRERERESQVFASRLIFPALQTFIGYQTIESGSLQGLCWYQRHRHAALPVPQIHCKALRVATGAPSGIVVGQRLRRTVSCLKCNKPRRIYCQNKMSVSGKRRPCSPAKHCGVHVRFPIDIWGGLLYGMVFVQQNFRWADNVHSVQLLHLSTQACWRMLPLGRWSCHARPWAGEEI